jgi:hypothetical protein
MESPNKRLKTSPPADFAAADDFVPLGGDDEDDGRFGYGEEVENEEQHEQHEAPKHAPRRRRRDYLENPGFQRRNAQDRPKSKHALPGHEPWVVVKTRFGRRFVHNTKTGVSLWHAPDDIWPAVKEFDQLEKSQKEKEANAKWAEEELKKMRERSKAVEVNAKADAEESRSRRQRSESLQREDEEAMMAELAAEAEHAEEQDVKQILKTLEPVAGDVVYDSEGSYEFVEVTDSEGEEGDEDKEEPVPAETNGEHDAPEAQDEGPVEFGEDDIAYQLAAMGEEYGLDPEEYGENDQGFAISDEDAANLFRDLLDDYRISPFTPWDKIIADESENSILHDDRYTVLPHMKARREVWDQWVKDKAAQMKEERARMEKKDPKIPYLAFLAEKATPKLYWPEFKRKFKKDAEMNDRKLSDKDREKLYRDHINRVKLPESTRKADLLALLNCVPLRDLHHETTLDSLPQQLLSHLHYISLPATTRDRVITEHISKLPPKPEGEEAELSAEQLAAEKKKRAEKERREAALAERRRQVEEEKRRTEKEERFARRELLEGEREVRRAMEGGRKGVEG